MYAKRYIACMHCFDVKPGVLEGDLQTFPDHQNRLIFTQSWTVSIPDRADQNRYSNPNREALLTLINRSWAQRQKKSRKLNPNKRNVANVSVVLQKCTFSGDWVRWTPTKPPTNCHQILILVLRLSHDRFKPMRKAENSNVKSEKNAYNLAENDVFHA